MISPTLKTTIDEAMKKLPRVVREGIHASSWERKILAIGRKHGLHVDQLEILQTELSLAVLGLTSRDEFARDTMREANISRDVMNKIIEDINNEIFIPIREYLKRNPIVSEESALEGESEELDQTEKDTLSRHGVSFGDDDNEQDIPPVKTESIVSTQNFHIQKPVSPEPLQKEASISAVPPNASGNTSSVLDIENLSYLDQVPQEELKNNAVQKQTETIHTTEPKKEILGDSLDPNKLKSSATEHLQTTIQNKGSVYEKDPYREPIE